MKTVLVAVLVFCSTKVFAAGWADPLNSMQAAVKAQAPEVKEIRMTIHHDGSFYSEVEEPTLGIHLQLDRNFGRDMDVRGDLNAHVFVADPRNTFRGVDVMGDGVNVSLRPFGSAYNLNGIYRREGAPADSDLGIQLQSYLNRDFAVHQKGMDLDFLWNALGYRIEGTIDSKVYGKRELTILGAAFAALSRGAFR